MSHRRLVLLFLRISKMTDPSDRCQARILGHVTNGENIVWPAAAGEQHIPYAIDLMDLRRPDITEYFILRVIGPDRYLFCVLQFGDVVGSA